MSFIDWAPMVQVVGLVSAIVLEPPGSDGSTILTAVVSESTLAAAKPAKPSKLKVSVVMTELAAFYQFGALYLVPVMMNDSVASAAYTNVGMDIIAAKYVNRNLCNFMLPPPTILVDGFTFVISSLRQFDGDL